jgi:hypothetical protein
MSYPAVCSKWVTLLGKCGSGSQKAEPNKRPECWMTIRAWGMPLPNIGSMDGNTGRSEGATAEKAVPFPCAVLDPNRSFVELRVGEPRPGARSVSSFELDHVGAVVFRAVDRSCPSSPFLFAPVLFGLPLHRRRRPPEGSLSVFVGRHGAMKPAGRVRCNMRR